MLLATVLVFTLPLTWSLVAYDCRSPGVSQPYLATSAGDCSRLSSSAPSAPPRLGTLLQIPVKKSYPAQTCKIERVSRKYYCSYWRFLNPIIDESMFRGFSPFPVSTSECRSWWGTGQASGDWGSTPLAEGETKIVLADGLTTGSGWCKGWTERLDVQAWRLTRATMSLTAVYSEDGSVSDFLLLEETLVTRVGHGSGSTAQGTSVLWREADFSPCRLDHVYQGDFNTTRMGGDSTWVFSRESGAAVRLLGTKSVCGSPLITTSEPFLFFKWGGNRRRAIGRKTPIGRLSTSTSTRSNYLLVLLLHGDQITRGLSFESMCKMEAEIRRIHLTDAGVSPSQLAFRTFGATGHALYQAGDGFRLAPCTHVDVKVDPQSICHNLVPVRRSVNATLEFWDPSTKSIHATAREISCDDPSLPIFTLGGAPHELSPTLKLVSNLGSLPSSVSADGVQAAVPSRGLYDSHVLMDTDPRVTMVEAAKQQADVISNSWEDLQSSGVLRGEIHPGDWAAQAMQKTFWGQLGGTTLWLVTLSIAVVLLWIRSSGATVGMICRRGGDPLRRSRTNVELEAELMALRTPPV